jgi:hypothetical protein
VSNQTTLRMRNGGVMVILIFIASIRSARERDIMQDRANFGFTRSRLSGIALPCGVIWPQSVITCALHRVNMSSSSHTMQAMAYGFEILVNGDTEDRAETQYGGSLGSRLKN